LALTPGTRLGVYEVTAPIGAGGMGEVYRATDRNPKRSVAIEVLPASVAGDEDRLGRFQREAEVLAALNHYGLAKALAPEGASSKSASVSMSPTITTPAMTQAGMSTDGGFSHGQPMMLVRDVGMASASSMVTRDHSRILIRVSPVAAMDKGEIRLLFGWQEALRRSKR